MKSRAVVGIKGIAPGLVLGLAVAWFFAPLLAGRAIVAEPDALAALLPLKAFLARALAAGEWPLWNPDAALGKPFLADLLAGALYPPNLLLAVAPFWRGLNLLFVAHYAFTALGALLWLRVSGLPRGAAVLGAVVWTFGGTMVSLGNVLNQLLSATWLPWVLWAWLRPRDVRAKVALASSAMACAFLAGGPEMVLVSAAALVLASRHPASLLVPPLAALLAAVELLPFWAYLGETWRGTHGIDAAVAMRYSVPPRDLVQLADAAWPPSPERFMPQIYVGPGVLALALIGLAAPRRGRAFWAAVAALAVLVVLGSHTPLYPFLYAHVPMSDLLRYPEKLFLGVHALLAAGAALGAATLADWAARRGGARSGARLAAALTLVLALAIFADLARSNRDALYAPPPEVILDPPPVARAILADAARASAPDGASGAVPRIFANPNGRPIPRSLPAAVALDRSLPWGAVAELYELANVNSPSSLNLVKHERLQEVLGAAPRDAALASLAALGTRYVTSWVRLDGAPGLRAIAIPDEPIGVKLYALEEAQPRAFLATRIVAVERGDAALEAFVSGAGGAHAGLAVLAARDARVAAGETGATDASAAPAAAREAAGGAGAVRWVASAPSRIELEVASPHDALLVVNDTLLAGWSASVDGRAVPLLEVNALVRGVRVPAGRHRIVMRYVPPGLLAGAGTTLAGLAGVAVLLVLARRRGRALVRGEVALRAARRAPRTVAPPV